MGCWEYDSTHHHQRATGKETTRKGHVLEMICMHGTWLGQGTPRLDDPRDWAHESAPKWSSRTRCASAGQPYALIWP